MRDVSVGSEVELGRACAALCLSVCDGYRRGRVLLVGLVGLDRVSSSAVLGRMFKMVVGWALSIARSRHSTCCAVTVSKGF